jgi:type II secretory pathway component PulF
LLQDVLFSIEAKIKKSLKMESVPSFKTRVKSFGSFYKKLVRIQPPSLGKQEMPVLTDLIGIRIICPFLEDLTIVENQLVKIFEIVEIERKGAGRTFSEFGYESVHILLKIPEEIKNQVEMGLPLQRALEKTGLYPPMVTNMVGIGEEAGSTEEMLGTVADYYEMEVEETTQQVAATLEPLLIIAMALICVAIIGGVFLPIISLYGQLETI